MMEAGLLVAGEAPQIEHRCWSVAGRDQAGDQSTPVPFITGVDCGEKGTQAQDPLKP